MSALLMGRVFYTDLPTHLRFCLLALADHANDDGASIFVGQERLARKLGVSDRSVRSQLAELRELGYIERTQAAKGPGRGKSKGTPDHYRILIEKLPGTDEIALMERPETSSALSDGKTGSAAPKDRKPTSETPEAHFPLTIREPPEEPSALAAVAARPRNIIWDALAEIYGQPTDTARTARGVAVKTLQAVGAEPDDLIEMFERFAGTECSWAVVTPTAMAKYFGQRHALDAQLHKRVPDPAGDLIREAAQEAQRAGA